MKNLVVLEQHDAFSSASQSAKELAVKFKESTGILRAENAWAVLVSESVAAVIAASIEEDFSDFDHEDCSSDPYDDDYQREVVQPLIEETQGVQDSWAPSKEEGRFWQDSWARSEGEGWFYED